MLYPEDHGVELYILEHGLGDMDKFQLEEYIAKEELAEKDNEEES